MSAAHDATLGLHHMPSMRQSAQVKALPPMVALLVLLSNNTGHVTSSTILVEVVFDLLYKAAQAGC